MKSQTDTPLILSVSGARGLVGQTMTPAVAADFAAAFGTHVKQESGEPSPLMCLGRDSRPSGEMLAAAAMAGLASTGCRVIMLGVVATPTVAVMVESCGAGGAIVVTASHNPLPWNGLKCLEAPGAAPSAEEAGRIIDRFQRRDFEYAAVTELRPSTENDAASLLHVDRVLAHVDPEPIRRRRFKVVLDSVNGAGGPAGRMLLERLGCEVVSLNGEPTGHFAHPPEPVEEHLSELAERTAAAGAAIGFAQDPDADRLAIVDEQGVYIGEEYTLVLAAWRVLDRQGPGTLAANLSTSRMIDDLADRYRGARVVRTPVGEGNVVAGMKSSGAILGGEGNGGVIYPPVCQVRDSLSSMALILGLLAAEQRPISAVAGDLPRYTMIKRQLDLSDVGGPQAVDDLVNRITAAFAGAEVDTRDGVRIDVGDAWVHVRPSNTEPIVRLIAEARTPQRARELIDEVTAGR